MGTRTVLNARYLEALGSARLAELLIDISKGRPVARRRLLLELAGHEGTGALATAVRRRLAAIGRSRSVLERGKRHDLTDELELYRESIVERIAGEDAAAALGLMWQFMGLANAILDRCHDGDDTFVSTFDASDLGDIASAAAPDPLELVDRVFEALTQNAYGQYDDLVRVMTPTLREEGLNRLKQLMIEYSKTPVAQLPEAHRPRIDRRYTGTAVEEEIAERALSKTVRAALQDIADAQGDVDAFIDQYDDDDRKDPEVAAGIARRLLAAGRADEALEATEDADHDGEGFLTAPRLEWEDARIDSLEAVGRSDEAQALRWTCFERSLSARHLRAYLRRLPDFDDLEAEEKALDHVQTSHSPVTALSFLISWPALDRAAALVIAQAGNFEGIFDDILTPAADALAARHPLAATLVLRAMIDHALGEGHSVRDKHVAHRLLDCSSLAPAVRDFGAFETHDAYEARLRREDEGSF